MKIILLVTLFAQSYTDGSIRGSGHIRVALGAEYDSNALRAIQTQNPSRQSLARDEIGNTLARLTVQLEGTAKINRTHLLTTQLIFGSKTFATRSSEDTSVIDLRINAQSRVHPKLHISFLASGKTSRVRNNQRSYDSGVAQLSTTIHIDKTRLKLATNLRGFSFRPEKRFSYFGPNGLLSLTYQAHKKLSFGAEVDYGYQIYNGNALVIATPIVNEGLFELTFCDEPLALRLRGFFCQSRPRRDRRLAASIRSRYFGSFIATFEYQLQLQRSTSKLENIDRHRLSLATTFSLPWRIDLNLKTTLQLTNNASIAAQQFIFEEYDENQNTLQVQFQRPITANIDTEIRYALFASQFGNPGLEFFRQTIYFGLAVHTRAP